MKKYNYLLVMALLSLLFTMITCVKPEPAPAPEVLARFTAEVDADNFLQVTFTNASENATTYAWDFGVDDITTDVSTEESPTYTYPAAGTYMVTLVATGEGGSTTSTVEVTLMDPDALLSFLAGTTSKKWILMREGIALGIGPAPNDNQWFAFGSTSAPLGDRPCILDDEYTFSRDGTFTNDTKGTFFLDAEANGGWNDAIGNETCHDETESGVFMTSAGRDYSDFANGGNYTFTTGMISGASIITILGAGAYIGLPAKTNAGDLGPDKELPAQYILGIFSMSDGESVDSMTLILSDGSSFFWNFYLVSYANESDVPPIPAANPIANFSYNTDDMDYQLIRFTNQSGNASSYMWDFGVDDIDTDVSTEENPTYTYASDGTYTVRLIAIEGDKQDTATQDITISEALCTTDDPSDTMLVGGMNLTFSDGKGFGQFGNIFSGVVDNPFFLEEGNVSCKVNKFEKSSGSETFAGAAINFTDGSGNTAAFDFTAGKAIKFKLYAQHTGTFRMLFQNLPYPDNTEEIYKEVIIGSGDLNQWLDLSLDFGDAVKDTVNYTNFIIYYNLNSVGAGETFYIDDITQDLSVPLPPLTCDADDPSDTILTGGMNLTFSDEKPFGQFGNIYSAVDSNPYINIYNSSCLVNKVVKTAGSETFAGAAINFTDGSGNVQSFDFTVGKIIKFQLYAEHAGTFRMLFQNLPYPDNTEEIYKEVTIGPGDLNQWLDLSLDFNDVVDDNVNYTNFIIYYNLNAVGADETFYIDNITQVLSVPPPPPLVCDADDPSDTILTGGMNLTFSDEKPFGQFGNIYSAVDSNPYINIYNSSCLVNKVIKTAGSETFAGSAINFTDGSGNVQSFDFTVGKIIKFQLYAEHAGTFRMLFQNLPYPDNTEEIYKEVIIGSGDLNQWLDLTLDFNDVVDDNVNYTNFIIYYNLNAVGADETFYIDNITQVLSVPPPPPLVCDADDPSDTILTGGMNLTFSDEKPFGQFGNIYSAVDSNPYIDIYNSSCLVNKVVKTAGSETFAGAAINFTDGSGNVQSFDFAAGKIIKFQLYAEHAGTFRMLFQNLPYPDNTEEIYEQVVIGPGDLNQWLDLTLDFNNIVDDNVNYTNFIIYYNLDIPGADETFYIDNITQE